MRSFALADGQASAPVIRRCPVPALRELETVTGGMLTRVLLLAP